MASTHSGEPLVFTVRGQLRMMLGDRAGALDDLKAFVDRTDYVLEGMLRQLIGMLAQAGRQDDARGPRSPPAETVRDESPIAPAVTARAGSCISTAPLQSAKHLPSGSAKRSGDGTLHRVLDR